MEKEITRQLELLKQDFLSIAEEANILRRWIGRIEKEKKDLSNLLQTILLDMADVAKGNDNKIKLLSIKIDNINKLREV